MTAMVQEPVRKGLPQAKRLLKEVFGFADFRGGQADVVTRLLEGRSTLAIFPTGGGKSLCYQLPALMLEGLTVVISPLIALMKDQIDFLVERQVPAARLDSSLDREATQRVYEDLRANRTRLLYVSPERLGQRAIPADARAANDQPARRRRGSLHQRMGPQLPPRLSQDRGAGQAACASAGCWPSRRRPRPTSPPTSRPHSRSNRTTSCKPVSIAPT